MNVKSWISIVTGVIALILWIDSGSGLARGSANQDPGPGGGWEYLIIQGGNVNLSGSDGGSMRKEPGAFRSEWYPLEKNLDKLGAKGWELVTVAGSPADPIFYMKRRK
ncbi:MAG TPA: hypothetical protein VKN18_15755 [Blastocatellia bacterium]|nr:hypothetical protein [Blastocatellia bacterium]